MSDYAFVHDGKAYTPNQTDVAAADAADHNAAIERAELAHWATAPDVSPLVYYHFPGETGYPAILNKSREYRSMFYPGMAGAHVSTWTGKQLGVIVSARVYHHNFGSRMVSMRVRGSNGATYSGRASWDWGSCITLRKVKG